MSEQEDFQAQRPGALRRATRHLPARCGQGHPVRISLLYERLRGTHKGDDQVGQEVQCIDIRG